MPLFRKYLLSLLIYFITGNYDVGTRDGLRYFLGFSHCSHFLNLKKGRTYLIMGTSGDIRKDEQNQSWVWSLVYTFFIIQYYFFSFLHSVCSCLTDSIYGRKEGFFVVFFLSCYSITRTQCILQFAFHRFEYVLGERTWVEYWPTDTQCQTDEYSPTCKGLEQLIYTYVNYGCPKKWNSRK